MKTEQTQKLDFEALVEEYYQSLFQFGRRLARNEALKARICHFVSLKDSLFVHRATKCR